MAKKVDLVQLIKENPGATFEIDNDWWGMYPANAPDDHNGDEERSTLASSNDDIKTLGDGGYGSGNCYGGDVLQALAAIVGVKVESV